MPPSHDPAFLAAGQTAGSAGTAATDSGAGWKRGWRHTLVRGRTLIVGGHVTLHRRGHFWAPVVRTLRLLPSRTPRQPTSAPFAICRRIVPLGRSTHCHRLAGFVANSHPARGAVGSVADEGANQVLGVADGAQQALGAVQAPWPGVRRIAHRVDRRCLPASYPAPPAAATFRAERVRRPSVAVVPDVSRARAAASRAKAQRCPPPGETRPG